MIVLPHRDERAGKAPWLLPSREVATQALARED